MRNTQVTQNIAKNNFQIIVLFVLLFIVPFATSLLLDLQIVQKFFVRQLIIYALMLVEAVILVFLLIQKLK